MKFIPWVLSVLVFGCLGAGCPQGKGEDSPGCPFPDGEDGDADHDGYTPWEGDCDDCSNQTRPGLADEVCDGWDRDCDGKDGGCVEPIDPPRVGFMASSPLGG